MNEMTFRASVPRPSGLLTLETGFALTASAMAQNYADPPSIYNRRTAEAPARRPQRPAPTGPERTYPQSAASAAGNGNLGQGAPRQLYPQPPRQPDLANRRAVNPQPYRPQRY